MRISTILLFASWVPLIQVMSFGVDIIFFPVTILLSIIGMWLFVKKLRKKVEPYKPIINFILLLFLSIILFGIHVFSAIVWFFKIDLSHHDYSDSSLGLILCIIPAAISCAALLLAWREAQKEDKPYLPVLKFILASVFVIWQLNLGFHFYTQMASKFSSCASVEYLIEESMRLTSPRQVLSIVYITVNILFFSDLLLRRKLKEGHYLFLSGAGLLILSGTYTVITLMVPAVKLLPGTFEICQIVVTLSFTALIGPVLVIAVILSGIGGILAIFKGISHRRIPASVVKGVFLSTITIILYMLLFKSLWPVRDPSMNVLIRMIKENRYGNKHYVIVPGFYYELLSFGKSAQGLLIEKLNDGDKNERSVSASILRDIGDQRAVPPLIIALKDTDEEVRNSAANSLFAIWYQRAIPDYMKEKIIEALLEIARELYKEKHKMAVTLIDALKYENTTVAESGVVEVLSCFKDAMVVNTLIEKLKGNIPDRLKSKINEALQEITRENYEGEPEGIWEWWQEWWDKNKVEFIRREIFYWW